jgi:hypothetical protein
MTRSLITGCFIIVAAISAAKADCPRVTPLDTVNFTKAKIAIAQRVLKQEKARKVVCDGQTKEKRGLCEEWAKASNDAAVDVEVSAFSEIDKLAAHP